MPARKKTLTGGYGTRAGANHNPWIRHLQSRKIYGTKSVAMVYKKLQKTINDAIKHAKKDLTARKLLKAKK